MPDDPKAGQPEFGGLSEVEFQDTLRALLPGTPPSARLEERVREIPQRGARPRPTPWHWRTGVVAALGVVIIAALLLMQPRTGKAELVAQMQAALKDVQSAHIVRWRVEPGGTRTQEMEIWYQSERWRIEDARATRIYHAGWFHVYEKRLGRRSRLRAAGPFAHSTEGMSPEAIGRSLVGWEVGQTARVSGLSRRYGRPLHVVTLTAPRRTERLLLHVDPRTNLPQLVESESKRGTSWRITHITKCSFNQPLSPALFDPQSGGAPASK